MEYALGVCALGFMRGGGGLMLVAYAAILSNCGMRTTPTTASMQF